MPTKLFSFICGLVYLFFGISGLFPGLVKLPPHRLRFYEMHIIGHWGFLFTWLPVNPVHNILYIIVGGAGVLAAVSFATAIAYSRGLCLLTLMFAFAGFLPLGVNYLWGLLPLFSWNVMLHVVTALLAYYYGWIYPLDLGGQEPPAEMAT